MSFVLRLLFSLWLSTLTLLASAADIEAGRALYFEGSLANGEKATVALADGTAIPTIACNACHRPSGLGSSEGPIYVPPIAGAYLYERQEARRVAIYRRVFGPTNELKQFRQPYDDDTLARAIVHGKGPADRELGVAMPRYELGDADTDNLIAYLKSISTAPDPGVDDSVLHLATIIDAGAAEPKQEAVTSLLETYVRDHNALTRNEIERKRTAPYYKQHQYSSYRQWRLHIWRLTGTSDTWPRQLQQYYATQEVFAVLGGVVEAQFDPVHEFCEQQKLPCLFPNTPLPVTQGDGQYTLYFSRGVLLEADVLATYLSRIESPADRPVIHQLVIDRHPASIAGAERVRQQGESLPLTVRNIGRADGPIDNLVIWGDSESLRTLRQSEHWPLVTSARRVFVSGTLSDDLYLSEPQAVPENAHLIYPFALPSDRIRQKARARFWLRAKKIPLDEERLQINTHFVAAMTGAAMTRMLDNFLRKYLIENLEHMAENALSTAVYPRLGLGPGQRFTSKGAYIARVDRDKPERYTLVSDWIVP